MPDRVDDDAYSAEALVIRVDGRDRDPEPKRRSA
jgi:hypothetical protein